MRLCIPRTPHHHQTACAAWQAPLQGNQIQTLALTVVRIADAQIGIGDDHIAITITVMVIFAKTHKQIF
jgi:hypothetical protein